MQALGATGLGALLVFGCAGRQQRLRGDGTSRAWSSVAPPAAGGARSAPAPSAEGTQIPLPPDVALLADAFRAAWTKGELGALSSLLDPAAQLVWGRGSAPDVHDVVFDVPSYTALWRYQAAGLAPDEPATFEVTEVSLHTATSAPTNAYELTVAFGVPLDVEEHVRYRVRFQGKPGARRLVELRRWPLLVANPYEDEPAYDAAKLADYDAAADAVPENEPRRKAEACRHALRFAEAADWYEKVVAAPGAPAEDWVALGWVSVFAGRLQRAEFALGEARRRDPTLPMPDHR